jgi:NitT/TauT family transport system substrate-binding protein
MRRKLALWLCSGIALVATQAWAEVGEARLGQQFGAVHLPAMVMESQQLVERHLAAAGLGNVKVGWVKLAGPAAGQRRDVSGSVHFGLSGGIVGRDAAGAHRRTRPSQGSQRRR